ncbi:MAG: universal stress protein [Alphaproteobacteria bacterium]|nr:universal stress protein [Alphaproteobacteria bacterium]
MKNSFLIAVDDSPGSGKAVDIAMAQAKRAGADLVVAYVIEWSAYSFNTPEENAERHKRREEEIDRAAGQIVEPVVAKIKAAGLNAEGVVRHGHPAQTLVALAEESDVSQIFIGRLGASGLKSMLFGSVAANLVQSSTVPVTVVP